MEIKKQREGRLNYFQFIQTVLLLPSKHAQSTNRYEDILCPPFLSLSLTHTYIHTHNKLKIYNGYNIKTI